MLTESIKNFRHVIWDWNGTLLNDVDIAVDAMNSMLKRRNLPFLDIERYRNIFTFPVKDYYTQLGFDFSAEPFEKLAAEYISTYNSYSYQFRLCDGVEEVLNKIGRLGITQSILSASREPELIEAVHMMNIKDYFIRIAGLNNHYAASKVARGKDLLIDLEIGPDEALLIGIRYMIMKWRQSWGAAACLFAAAIKASGGFKIAIPVLLILFQMLLIS